MYADFIISMGMFTRRDNNGNLKAKDALIGLEMVGKATYDAEVTLGIEARSALRCSTKDLSLMFLSLSGLIHCPGLFLTLGFTQMKPSERDAFLTYI